MDYNFKKIEAKWIKYWKKNNTYLVQEDPDQKNIIF